MNFGLIARLTVGSLALAAWLYLLFCRGQFWKTEERLEYEGDVDERDQWPEVAAIIPARNEAAILPETLPSVLKQSYPGNFRIYLISDRSEDGTARKARQIYRNTETPHSMEAISGEPLPEGWTGKVWAMRQGYQKIRQDVAPDYIWLTDADIFHPPHSLKNLVSKAEGEELSMVSLMALLNTGSFWGRVMLPAFVFFFRKLYPFRWVNDTRRSTAAAAGGCILVDYGLLEEVSGFSSISHCRIDDCSLARLIWDEVPDSSIWLGLTKRVRSLREYGSISEIWDMVARNAAAQLGYSSLVLVLVVAGMLILYAVPPLLFLWGVLGFFWQGISFMTLAAAIVPFLAWVIMVFSFVPTLHFYGLSGAYGLILPFVSLLYVSMTVDSLRRAKVEQRS